MSEKIKHLLIPKEFKVFCLPNRSADSLAVTSQPSKATCANCLTLWRKKPFRVAHTANTREKHERDIPSEPRCAVCGGVIYLESPAEGYTCTRCGASDSDE